MVFLSCTGSTSRISQIAAVSPCVKFLEDSNSAFSYFLQHKYVYLVPMTRIKYIKRMYKKDSRYIYIYLQIRKMEVAIKLYLEDI